MEGASLKEEGDDNMADRWAALLVNAAADSSDVPPSFPAILSELTSLEARLLDHVYNNALKQDRSAWLQNRLKARETAGAFGVSDDAARIAIENL
jgi:hypothetical protein